MSDRQPSDAQSVPGMPSLALLMDTDHLLDRLGDRSPRPTDLDDPLAAALALLAADVDLEPMPSNTTRRRLASVGAWPLRQDLRSAAFESVRHVVDVGAEESVAGEDVDGSAEDSIDDLAEGYRAGRLAPTREVGIRLVPALVAAGAAIVLSMGAAAALSSGETLNPAKAVKDIVQEITGDPTAGSAPNGATALAEAEGRGVPGSVSGGSPGGGGQSAGPGALPGVSLSPTTAPSGIAGLDGTSPGTLTPGLLDFLPVLPAPTLPGTDGAAPGSSSGTPGAGSSGTGSTDAAGSGTGSSSTGSSGASSSETSSETSSSGSATESSSAPASPEPTTPDPTPSVGPTGSTTPPEPSEPTTPPETTPPNTTAPPSSTVSDDQSSADQVSVSVTVQAWPLGVDSPLPTVELAEPTSELESVIGDVVATIPVQASLTASGGV